MNGLIQDGAVTVVPVGTHRPAVAGRAAGDAVQFVERPRNGAVGLVNEPVLRPHGAVPEHDLVQRRLLTVVRSVRPGRHAPGGRGAGQTR